MKKLLEIENLQAAYGQSAILWGVDMSAEDGKVTTIMGRNGVGKTTLMRTIMGLVKTTGGSITFDGNPIISLPTEKRAQSGIAYVPQGREIIPKLTVYENILIGTEALTTKDKTFDEDEIYSIFPILKTFRNRLGGNLSGGQQQQLAIARALVGNPKLLILDEPTEGIQPSITLEIADVLKDQIAKRNLAVLLVEQKLDFAKLLTDDYFIMDRGKVVRNFNKDNADYDELKSYLSV
ncbi:MAG: urea ABC transporter ATP-binding subunit UrtE [Rikenellaceae bacterium]